MKKHGKKYTQAKEKISETKQSKSEAIKTCQEVASAKFDESIDASFSLGIDPKDAEQNIRSTVSLPHGTGRVSIQGSMDSSVSSTGKALVFGM